MACSGCRKSRNLVDAYNNYRNSSQVAAIKKLVEPEVVYKRINGRLVAEVVETPKEEES